MSEVQAPAAGGDMAPAPLRDPVAAGQRLKQAREAAGLHVVALAAALKVPVKKLEALEAGRTGELPDATFARALAASVCRQLKIDPAEILSLLPQAGGGVLGAEQGLNTPFRASRDAPGPVGAAQGIPKAVWLALVILLGAAVVWWAVPPASEEASQVAPTEPLAPAASSEGATSMGAGANVSQETTAPPSDVPAASATVAPAGPVPASGGEGGSAGQQAAPPPVPNALATTAPTAAAAPAASAAMPATAADVLVLRAKADSWVEVSSGGKLVLQRVIKAGESVALGEAPPLAVVVGRVDATEVLVRGQPFDLTAVARNNVARFEVK